MYVRYFDLGGGKNREKGKKNSWSFCCKSCGYFFGSGTTTVSTVEKVSIAPPVTYS